MTQKKKGGKKEVMKEVMIWEQKVEESPDHIKEFYKKYDIAEKIADTHGIHLSDAYNKYVLENLKDKEGNVDLKRLEKRRERKKLAKGIAEHLVGEIKKSLEKKGMDFEKLSEAEKGMLLKGYYDISYEELHANINKLYERNGKYTSSEHAHLVDSIKGNIEERLKTSAGSHLDEEHNQSIAVFTGLSDAVEHEFMRDEDRIGFLRAYKGTKGAPLSPEILKEKKHLLKEPYRKAYKE